MTKRETGRWQSVAKGVGFVAAAAVLCVLAFALSFHLALKHEMRATSVVVPDLAGLTLEDAEDRVRPAGLVVEWVEQRHDPTVPSGRVLQQEPLPGSTVRRGRKVKVVTSLGDRVLTVPSLIGQGARAVDIELRRQGFAPGSEARTHSNGVASGVILAQVPAAGTPAVPGSRVHRLVSDGRLPRQWVMPDLRGRPRETAERWIDLCGFRRGAVRVVDDADSGRGTIVGQLPLAGYPLSARGVVDLTVAR